MSPSKLSTYLVCPVKYRWTYLDERGKWYLRSKSYFSFGSSLHQVLQRFHDSNDTGVTTTHEAVSALEEDWISAGYASQDEMQQALAEGKDILTGYVERHEARQVSSQTILVERQMRADLGEFVLIGRIDRLDEHEDGSLEIVDYKSGRQVVTEEEIGQDLAMSIYQFLVREKFPGRPVRATIIALRSGSQATAELTDPEIEAFIYDLKDLANEILSKDFENVRPVVKPHCPTCDFLPLCRKDPEFEVDFMSLNP